MYSLKAHNEKGSPAMIRYELTPIILNEKPCCALFRNDVNCGNNSFRVIDTPGTDSDVDTYEYAILLMAGLTSVDLNTIFIIVQFQNIYKKIH